MLRIDGPYKCEHELVVNDDMLIGCNKESGRPLKQTEMFAKMLMIEGNVKAYSFIPDGDTGYVRVVFDGS